MIETLRLGHDVRFVLVCVGGGAIRIGREIARQHLRYLETVAVNCDSRVQDAEEFDRRVFLGTPSAIDAGTGGSPTAGARLAHAAEPALERIFEGTTFVTILASLGGGTGTGALPFVLDAAARSAEFVSVFAVKPFRAEGERRATAERALGRLHFVDGFIDKRETGRGWLHMLDNETLVPHQGSLPFNRVAHHWAEVVGAYIEHSIVAPIEAVVEARRIERLAESEPVRAPPPQVRDPMPPRVPEPPLTPMPLAPTLDAGIAELTFEVLSPTGGPEMLR
ncbi:MAG: hypothetical protein L3K17_00785 [Thermoplasmata archaeon]|nr:hypothetical protein [Thermoplasmata archaeon]